MWNGAIAQALTCQFAFWGCGDAIAFWEMWGMRSLFWGCGSAIAQALTCQFAVVEMLGV
ncbi:hypothetical protein H6G54_07200 [Anabaena cylindrica FACHB-243]|uniref:hypothetical protein n=1 Tax=Anabaena TaxID=1163 RepID=UPI0003031EA6|nr:MULTISPECIES: hypothetical protein [Anabaena]MBD2417495.1 hypothetical protein [Anabaena cylindrica FACHB-243]MBY5307410.1 hypothetical protein [Anabaena sp. CCAP 1446/1C]MCM2407664.1 hypothetical protein [Anabaena sp. CCAP 1446/1C]